MAQLKEILLKINGIKKTKQITKAMNMVAASKLRGAQTSSDAFRPYSQKFSEVLGSLAESSGEQANELLVPRERIRKVHIVLCASDRGLCGGFNINLIEKAEALAKEKEAQGAEVSFSCFGKKGMEWAKKRKKQLVESFLGVIGSKVSFTIAAASGRNMVSGFLDQAYDEVYIVYAQFISMAKQLPTIKQLLPIPPIEKIEANDENGKAYQPEHICEPSSEALVGELLPKSVQVQIFSALLETSTSEHAARMMAMDNATKACNDMLESLSLIYNKARQAAITADLMDIVGGAEALKG
ncbi:MAG: ATP synthase F1 subunit gamma [Desulfobacteraceae bacterium]|nr:ATP synthase F1 subunit gamma [Desulfobacteraceae bacterium]